MAVKKLKYSGKYPPKHFNRDIILKETKKHEDNIRLALKTHGKEVKTELKKVISTSVGNGVHYSGLPKRSSSAGNAPVSQSGKLEDGFGYKTSVLTLNIFNKTNNKGAPYPAFLEEGTKRMKARPYFQCTIESLHMRLYNDLQDITI